MDTLVDKSDGPHVAWAALHFLLTTKAQQDRFRVEARTRQAPRGGETRTRKRAMRSNRLAAALGNRASPFSAELWKGIPDRAVRL